MKTFPLTSNADFFFAWESMGFQLNYPPERGIGPEQTLTVVN